MTLPTPVGIRPTFEMAKILRRHVHTHITDRDKVLPECWLILAVVMQTLADAATGSKDDKADALKALTDGRCAMFVSALGISPAWFTKLCLLGGYLKPLPYYDHVAAERRRVIDAADRSAKRKARNARAKEK